MKLRALNSSKLLTIAFSFLAGVLCVFFLNSTVVTSITTISANAVENGQQIFCSNKLDGTLSISKSGACEMNTQDIFVFLSVAQVGSNGFAPKSICGTTGKSLCRIGVIGPGGGTIFFVDSNNDFPGFTYLEAAPGGWNNLSTKADPTLGWCNDTTHIIQKATDSWISRSVGSGKANTAAMQLSCTAGAAIAVKEFNTSKRSKFSDWFIPSLGELILMGTNLQGRGDLGADDYWSSSEFSDIGAWVQSIGHGYQGNANKATLFHIRPIRAF